MQNLHGTKTEKNLMLAFATESQARNRYTYFSGQAKKEGYEQMAAIFEETANQEKEHAKRFFKFLQGGNLEVQGTFPAGPIGTTLDNLKSAAQGEHHEWNEMYPHMAEIADKEGFKEIADVFRSVSQAEKFHEERYLALATNIEKGDVFDRLSSTTWRCRNCGYIHHGKSAPEICPACAHPQAYFELLCQNW